MLTYSRVRLSGLLFEYECAEAPGITSSLDGAVAMKPRTAGILGMLVGLCFCIGGGFLLPRPPVWFLGVVLLVGGTILFSIATTWILRSSWAKDDWPGASISEEKRRRRQRRLMILQCILACLLIGLSTAQLVIGQTAQGSFSLVLGVVFLAMSVWALRLLAKSRG